MCKINYILIGLGLILLTAFGAQMLPRRFAPSRQSEEPLAVILPGDTAGWSYRDQPIADTAEMRRAVGEMLNYNEAVFRVYRKNSSNAELAVYVAYWEPGRVHPRLVAQHTPDACWVEAGWTMSDPRYAEVVALAGNKVTKPGQYRCFSLMGQLQYVIYWHLVDGEPSAFTGGPSRRAPMFLTELWHDLFRVQGAQYFIRISSNVPFEQLSKEAHFVEVMGSLAKLGLAK
jgi:hypothetical protein